MSQLFAKSLYQPRSPSLVSISRVQPISPGLVRITCHGPGLQDFPKNCPAAHIKVFLPLAGQAQPILPDLSGEGRQWPAKDLRPVVRTFTLRSCRPQEGEVDIEFSQHPHGGPASTFAMQAKVGDVIGLSYPGGPDPMIPPAATYVFLGDLSALPAISAILEVLPASVRGHALIQLHDARDQRDLTRPEGLCLEYFQGALGSYEQIISRLKALDLSVTDSFYWLGGEQQLVLQARNYLRREVGASAAQLYAVPYWRHRLSEEGYHHARHELMDSWADNNDGAAV